MVKVVAAGLTSLFSVWSFFRLTCQIYIFCDGVWLVRRCVETASLVGLYEVVDDWLEICIILQWRVVLHCGCRVLTM